jgi:hypothetical protein
MLLHQRLPGYASHTMLAHCDSSSQETILILISIIACVRWNFLTVACLFFGRRLSVLRTEFLSITVGEFFVLDVLLEIISDEYFITVIPRSDG